jgi:hypothetical protein
MNVCEGLLAASLESITTNTDTTEQGVDTYRLDHGMCAHGGKDNSDRASARGARERRRSDVSGNTASTRTPWDSAYKGKSQTEETRDAWERGKSGVAVERTSADSRGHTSSKGSQNVRHGDDSLRGRGEDHCKHAGQEDDRRPRDKGDNKRSGGHEDGRRSRDRDSKHTRREGDRRSGDRDDYKHAGQEDDRGSRDKRGTSRDPAQVGSNALDDTRHTFRDPDADAPASSKSKVGTAQRQGSHDAPGESKSRSNRFSRQDSRDTCNEGRAGVGSSTSRPLARSSEGKDNSGSVAAKQAAFEHVPRDDSSVSSRSSRESKRGHGHTYRDCTDDFKNGSEASAADTCVLKREPDTIVRRSVACTLSCDDALRALWGCAVYGICAKEWQSVLWDKILRKWNHGEVAKVRAHVCSKHTRDEILASRGGDQAHVSSHDATDVSASLQSGHGHEDKLRSGNRCEKVGAGDAEQQEQLALNANCVKLDDEGKNEAGRRDKTVRSEGVEEPTTDDGDHVMQDVHVSTTQGCKVIAGEDGGKGYTGNKQNHDANIGGIPAASNVDENSGAFDDLMRVSSTIDMLRQVAVSWRNAGWSHKHAHMR